MTKTAHLIAACTDVALEIGERRYTAKNLTTPRSPEEGVLTALRAVISEAGIAPSDVDFNATR
jgi:N-methylhydantoinase A